jgi:hypothetical protein
MGTSSKPRTRQSSGSGKGLLRGARDTDSRRSPRTLLASPAKPPSPPSSTVSDPETATKTIRHDSINGSEDIAPEIVVWTEDMDNMVVDSPESAAPTTPATPAVEGKAVYVQSLFMCPCSFICRLVLLTHSLWSLLSHAMSMFKLLISVSALVVLIIMLELTSYGPVLNQTIEHPYPPPKRHPRPQRCRIRYRLERL